MTNVIHRKRSDAGNPHALLSGAMKTVLLLGLFCGLMVGTAVAAQQGQVTDRGYEITVNGADVTLNGDDVAALVNEGTSRDLYKLGTGRLIIATDLEGAGYEGAVHLEAGYIRASADGAIGKNRQTNKIVLYIESDASLELDAAVSKGACPLKAYVSGSGVNGAGAVYSIGSTERKNNFNPNDLYLEGDTLMVAQNGSWGLSTLETVNLQNHTLTISGGKTFYIVNAYLTGPGEVSVTGGTRLFFENQAQNHLQGSPLIRLAEGTKIRFGGNAPTAFTKSNLHGQLIVDGDATFEYGYWDTQLGGTGRYDGAIDLRGTLTISSFVDANASKFRLGGVISGNGGIVYDSVSTETFQITNAASVIEGNVSVRQGSLQLNGKVLGNVVKDPAVQTLTVADVGGNVVATNGTVKVGDVGGVLRAVNSSVNAGKITGVAGEKGTVVVDLSGGAEVTDDYLYGLWRSYTDNAVLETDLVFERDQSYRAIDKSGDVLQMPVIFPAGPYDYQRAFSDGVVATHAGADSTLNLGGEMTGAPSFKNYSGSLVFAGQNQSAGWVDVRGGTATVAADATVCRNGNVWCVAAGYPEVARLRVYGDLTTTKATGIYAGRNFCSAPTDARGIVEIFDGATLHDPFHASGNSCNGWSVDALKPGTGCGAYYQHGGDVLLHAATAVFMGSGFGTYYSLEGGTFTLAGNTYNQFRMSTKQGCHSTFVQNGGAVTVTNFTVYIGSNAGDATYYLSDGEMQFASGGITLCRANDEQTANGSHGILTLDGPNAKLLCGKGRPSLCRQSDSVAELNINDGASMRVLALRGCKANVDSGTIANTRTIVTANGGKINLAPTDNTYYAYAFWEFVEANDRVTVYEKGLTLDVDELPSGVEFKTGMPLSAPAGKGVDAIQLPEGMSSLAAWEYIAAPTVKITDPTGTGSDASAIALFDTTTGKVTGFRVMNRGNNYTRAVATVTGGGSTKVFEIECALTDNVSGGLTKDGVGTLVVNKPCTYTGKTVLRKGQLRLNVDKALMVDSCVVLAGGTLNMNGKTLSDGSTAVKNWGADIPTALADGAAVYDALSFAEGSEITVSGAEALLDPALEDVKSVVILQSKATVQNPPTVKIEGDIGLGEWKIRWRGNSLKATRPQGMVLTVR